ncbi:MAG: VIT1/CCC1 transporter family protein [Deltaproteobacteria bacterium]|nr:VIT1/CCC1 transporter family protein [Deltaproteobacteria bacterium]
MLPRFLNLKNLFDKGVRDIIFGTQDGLVSTMGALTGIAQGTGDPETVVIAGIVIVTVESLSMAAGSYLSTKAHRQYQEHLLENEKQEIENDIGNEEREILEMYQKRGYAPDEIEIIKKRLLSDRDLLLEDMAHKELGIVPGRLENPLSNGILMGFSYLAGGSIPLLPYLIIPDLVASGLISFGVTGLALFGLGAMKGKLFGISWIKSGLEIFLVAGGAAIIGYLIGTALKML